MPCEAEERAVAKIKQRQREAERYMQLEKPAASGSQARAALQALLILL